MPRKTEPHVDLMLPEDRMMDAPAAVWKRVLSFVLDILILQVIVISPFSGVLQDRIPMSKDFQENYMMYENNPELATGLLPLFFVIFGLIFLYFVVFEYKMAQTPGKMIMGIKVKSTQNDLKLTFVQAAMRNAVILLFVPLWFVTLIDVGYMLFTGSRLSDRISKTTVIEEIKI